jgi:hypothetical protein
MNNIVQFGCLISKLLRLFVNFPSAIVGFFYRVWAQPKFPILTTKNCFQAVCEPINLSQDGFVDFENPREIRGGEELLIIGKRNQSPEGKYDEFPNFQISCSSLPHLLWDKDSCVKVKGV